MKESIRHEQYIKRCIELGSLGLGRTAPNPMVGSVIVARDRIIGEGYHHQYGSPHAEANAVQSVAEKSLLKESTLYVNLEPCSHKGKTPPCADLIIQTGISQAVIGIVDPNPLVSGKGIEKLRSAGINTHVGVLQEDCMKLNRRFIAFHAKKRPYIILKWARTKDGFIDINRNSIDHNKPAWISNQISKKLVHKWRTEEQAILIGTNTALLDNPRLNVREWHGSSPVRMVIDRELRLPFKLNLFDNAEKTCVFNNQISKTEGNTEYIQLDFNENILPQIMDYAYEKGIHSIIVEGGKKLIDSMLAMNLWDEARVFTGDRTFRTGIPSPVIHTIIPEEYHILDDLLQVYKNHRKD